MEAKMRQGGNSSALDPYAIPTRVPEIEKKIFVCRQNQRPMRVVVDENTVFRRKKGLRWRIENFGATVVGEKANSRMFLNKEGFRLLMSMEPNLEYSLSDPALSWGEVEPLSFLSLLLQKGGIEVVERR